MSEKLHFDLVVIGFGKAGKTLAGAYAQTGKSVALIEQSAQMYGEPASISVVFLPRR